MTIPDLGAEHSRSPRRLIAAHEIAQTERNWSAARAYHLERDMEGLSSQERIARFAVHNAFYELVEIQGAQETDAEAVLQLFAESTELTNATLARIEMAGRWDAADPFERELFPIASQLFDNGYRDVRFVPRTSDDAKRTITIPAGFTKEHNFVALRRNRLLMRMQHQDANALRPIIEVDKVSTFALDIGKLSQLNDPAVDEVRLIVASTMYRAVDWETLRQHTQQIDDNDTEAMFEYLLEKCHALVSPHKRGSQFDKALTDFLHLSAVMDRYNMTLEEIHTRAYYTDDSARLHHPEGTAFIEQALHERSDLLTPAATTYYVHA